MLLSFNYLARIILLKWERQKKKPLWAPDFACIAFYLSRSIISPSPIVVFLYTLFFTALFGCNTPMPFLPYNGLTALLISRLTRPFVLAEMLFLMLGVRIPIFMPYTPFSCFNYIACVVRSRTVFCSNHRLRNAMRPSSGRSRPVARPILRLCVSFATHRTDIHAQGLCRHI